MSFFAPIAGGTPLAVALAEELVIASRMLGDLAYDLGSDAATLRRHMTSLQTIDHITQMQLAIADLLRHDAGEDDALAGVTLADMAERLRTAVRSDAAIASGPSSSQG